jgi:hypothetical protein
MFQHLYQLETIQTEVRNGNWENVTQLVNFYTSLAREDLAAFERRAEEEHEWTSPHSMLEELPF